jgi:hypothetical protein
MSVRRRRIVAVPAAVSLLVLLSGCGSSTRTVTVNGPPPGARPSGVGAPGASSTAASQQPATRVVHETRFLSPSGNIGCALLGGVARCDIQRRGWSPPARPTSCPAIVDFGQGLEVGTAGSGRFVCSGDTVRDPASPKLAYGTASRSGGFLCTSARNGVTCAARASRHGFFLSVQSYRIF